MAAETLGEGVLGDSRVSQTEEDWIQVPPRNRRPWKGFQSTRGEQGFGRDRAKLRSTEDPRARDRARISVPDETRAKGDVFKSVQRNNAKSAHVGNSEIQKQLPKWRFQSGTPSSWKEICSMGRQVNEDCILQFHAPLIDDKGIYASIPKSAIDANVNKWCNTLVGYVMGDRPFYSQLKGCVGRLWRPTCSLEIHSRENGYFFFKFGSKDECDRVLNEGPWLFDGRLIILKPWSPNIGLERDILSTVPVWIRFPSLHLKLWSNTVISYMASLIGKPLYMDNATATGERLEFARCFVEISACSKLPKSVRLDLGNGEWLETPVHFEWVPPKCSKCQTFGHIDVQCPNISMEEGLSATVSDKGKGKEIQQNDDSILSHHQNTSHASCSTHVNNSGNVVLINQVVGLAKNIEKGKPVEGTVSGTANYNSDITDMVAGGKGKGDDKVIEISKNGVDDMGAAEFMEKELGDAHVERESGAEEQSQLNLEQIGNHQVINATLDKDSMLSKGPATLDPHNVVNMNSVDKELRAQDVLFNDGTDTTDTQQQVLSSGSIPIAVQNLGHIQANSTDTQHHVFISGSTPIASPCLGHMQAGPSVSEKQDSDTILSGLNDNLAVQQDEELDFQLTEVNPDWIVEKNKLLLKSKAAGAQEQVQPPCPKRSTRSNKGITRK
jgi:hypothetical protein